MSRLPPATTDNAADRVAAKPPQIRNVVPVAAVQTVSAAAILIFPIDRRRAKLVQADSEAARSIQNEGSKRKFMKFPGVFRGGSAG